jgi:predicted dithiol-disulfide oxidoreductase (DUF899 family)
MKTSTIERPKVVSQAEWEAARKELLIKEKHLTRQRDEVDRQRRGDLAPRERRIDVAVGNRVGQDSSRCEQS